MQLKTIAAAAALSFAAVGSFAMPLDPLSPSASFSNTVTGAFTDVWTFNLGTESAVAASITNVEVTFAGMSAGKILGFMAYLNGTQLFGPTSSVTAGGITVTTQVLAGGTTLPAGMYELTISGTGITGANASYGGNIVATPVPEPETYALMLAGLAAVGFVAARRRNQG
jgi:hypothetical protein